LLRLLFSLSSACTCNSTFGAFHVSSMTVNGEELVNDIDLERGETGCI